MLAHNMMMCSSQVDSINDIYIIYTPMSASNETRCRRLNPIDLSTEWDILVGTFSANRNIGLNQMQVSKDSGNLYYISNDNKIVKITPQGVVTKSTNAILSQALDIAVNENLGILVASNRGTTATYNLTTGSTVNAIANFCDYDIQWSVADASFEKVYVSGRSASGQVQGRYEIDLPNLTTRGETPVGGGYFFQTNVQKSNNMVYGISSMIVKYVLSGGGEQTLLDNSGLSTKFGAGRTINNNEPFQVPELLDGYVFPITLTNLSLNLGKINTVGDKLWETVINAPSGNENVVNIRGVYADEEKCLIGYNVNVNSVPNFRVAKVDKSGNGLTKSADLTNIYNNTIMMVCTSRLY